MLDLDPDTPDGRGAPDAMLDADRSDAAAADRDAPIAADAGDWFDSLAPKPDFCDDFSA
jgi:hypothetical protein